jgi:hypothetical protein
VAFVVRRLPLAQSGGWRVGRACPLCPGISDINLFRYCQGVIDFDASIADVLLIAAQRRYVPEADIAVHRNY